MTDPGRSGAVRGLAISALAIASLSAACGSPRDVAVVADALTARSRGELFGHEGHQRELLAEYLRKDDDPCLPPAEQVLAPPPGSLAPRRVVMTMPHYDWVDGPMRFRIGARGGKWRVLLNVALRVDTGATLELPDCALRDALAGAVHCEGTPYEQDPGVEACPGSGRFEAEASRANLIALLERWSRDVEGYFNRDAEHYDLPVRYDFEFFLDDDASHAVEPVDLVMPLEKSCARTPYFSSLRTGWSIPILAHEMAHFLGLLDEYEALSGLTSLYPKTPYEGSEGSRMGLSMKPETRLYPQHHYLVLRRLHCGSRKVDPAARVLLPEGG